MSDFFLPNYKTSWFETLVFPFFPVYSERHLEEGLAAKTWQGKTVHLWTFCMERIPVVGAVIALAELILACLFQHAQKEESEPFKAEPLPPEKEEEIKEELLFLAPILQEQKKAEDEKKEGGKLAPFIAETPLSPVVEIPVERKIIEEINEIPNAVHFCQQPPSISPGFKSPAILSPFAVGEGLDVASQREATYRILTTKGFVKDFDDVKHPRPWL